MCFGHAAASGAVATGVATELYLAYIMCSMYVNMTKISDISFVVAWKRLITKRITYIYTVCINKYPHVRSLSAVPNTNWMCTWFVLRLICPSTFQSSHAGISWECSWGSPEHPSATRILTGRLYRACGTRTRVLYREIQGRWFLISNIHIIMK